MNIGFKIVLIWNIIDSKKAEENYRGRVEDIRGLYFVMIEVCAIKPVYKFICLVSVILSHLPVL